MRTAAASILREPGIAARYVRTDPQAAAETMSVAWVLKHHVIKHGLLGPSFVYFNDFPFEMPIYWIYQLATFNVDDTPSLRVSRSFVNSSLCRGNKVHFELAIIRLRMLRLSFGSGHEKLAVL